MKHTELIIISGSNAKFTTKDIIECDNIIQLIDYKNIHEFFIFELEIKYTNNIKNGMENSDSFRFFIRLQNCLLNQIESKIAYLQTPQIIKVKPKQLLKLEMHNDYIQKENKFMYLKLKSILSEEELNIFFKERTELRNP